MLRMNKNLPQSPTLPFPKLREKDLLDQRRDRSTHLLQKPFIPYVPGYLAKKIYSIVLGFFDRKSPFFLFNRDILQVLVNLLLSEEELSFKGNIIVL